MKSLECLGLALLRAFLIGLVAQLVREAVEVDIFEKLIDSFGTHLGYKLFGVAVFEALVVAGKLVENFEVFFLGEEVETGNSVAGRAYLYVGCGTGVDNHIALVVDYGIELLGGKAEKVTYFIGERAEIPNVGYGYYKTDMTHALAAHFLLGYFHRAAVAHDAFVADALVLTAVALVVFYRSEDTLAEETVALGLVGAVVDCFGLENLTARVREDFFGRCEAYGNLREDVFCFIFFSKSHI